MQHRATILGIALACIAFGAPALTLGRLQGAALIGQPLNVGVEIQLDAGDDALALCLDAEVFHADTRQDPSRVRVVLEAPITPSVAHVRIISSALIEEPVVAFNLRTGCGQKTTRRYVLLADLPTEAAAPPALLATALAPVPVKPETASPEAAASLPTRPVAATAVPAPKKASTLVAQRRSAPEIQNKPAARSAGLPRLQLNPLAQLPQRVSSPLPAVVPASAAASAPDAALLASQKVQQLEGDVKALRDAALKREASLVVLKARLKMAEAERFPAGLIYALAALLLTSLLATLFFWRRQRGVPPAGLDRWRAAGATAGLAASGNEAQAPDALHQPSTSDLDPVDIDQSIFAELMRSNSSDAPGREAHTEPARLAPAAPLDWDLSDIEINAPTEAAAPATDIDLSKLIPGNLAHATTVPAKLGAK